MNTASRLGALLTWLWWRAALIRATRTGLVIAVPYLGGSLLVDVPWLTAASAAALGFVLSLVTSVGGIVEADGGQVSWWYAIRERVTKSFAQTLGVGIGQVVLFEQVDWPIVLQAAVIAALGSLLLGFITRLPEAPALPSPVTITTTLHHVDAELAQTTQGTTVGVPSGIIEK